MNNSASRLKIALDSASLFLGSASLVEESQYFSGRVENHGVEGWLGELCASGLRVVELDESRGDSAS